jgi:AcrR family transcriptional regulator
MSAGIAPTTAPATAPAPRDRILDAATLLFRRQGYAATGIKEIVGEAGAPLGSLYHYFPGGKEQIAVEAVTRAGEKLRRTMEAAAEVPDLPAAVNAYFTVHAQRLADSDFELGCPIAMLALETASVNDRIRQVCEDVFDSWQSTLKHAFAASGIPDDDAGLLATFVLSSYEGALTLSRAFRNIEPMVTSGAAVAALLQERLDNLVSAG